MPYEYSTIKHVHVKKNSLTYDLLRNFDVKISNFATPILRFKKRGLVDENGLTNFGKLAITSAELGLRVPTTMVISWAFLEHQNLPPHDIDCPVSLELRKKLRFTWKYNTVKMLVSELAHRGFLRRTSHKGQILFNHSMIETLRGTTYFQDIIDNISM